MFVDDSRDFLLNFTLQLDENIAFQLHDSPYKALEVIHQAQKPSQVNERVLSEYLDASGCPITNYTVNLDLAAIHWEVYNPQRFNEVSVVVVDYAMPGMSGLEFCSRMENSPIKRVLLTGKADEKTAVQAFNEGIIDLYIQKQNTNITKLINESIASMQLRYFQNMSDIITKMLSVSSPSCLQDYEFSKLFFALIEEHKIVEYYLTENSGSFLLLDGDANISYLVIKTEQDLKLNYELALDNKAPQQVLEKLKTGEVIPYFWQTNNFSQSQWDDWATYLHPAKKLVGKETYYYAYIENPTIPDLHPEKIVSYNSYLEQLDSSFR
jgi:CheY-like chemotaxis protein